MRDGTAGADRPLLIRILLLASLLLGIGTFDPAEAAFDAHGGPVKGIAVSADGKAALTASFDYSIILWNLAEQSVTAELHGHDAAVNAVVFAPDDQHALSASDDGSVGFWDLSTGELITRLEGHAGKVVDIAVSPDGSLAASAGWDRTIHLWDLETRQVRQTLRGSENFNTVAFDPTGEHVLAGSSEGALHVWRVNDGTQMMAIDRHDFAVTSLDQSPDGETVVTASVDETVQVWDLDEGDVLATLYGHRGPVLAVALSDDGELVASGGVDGTVRVWRRGDGDRLKVYARHKGAVWSVVFAPDGETLLSGGADGLVLTYNVTAEEPENGITAAETEHSSPEPVSDQLSRGEKLFKTCIACHTTGPDGGHRAGPTLYKLFGRKAGSHPDYRYSKALQESDLIWSEETIHRLFEIGPDHLLPGTKMPLQRMPSLQDRADLIAFLKRVTTP